MKDHTGSHEEHHKDKSARSFDVDSIDSDESESDSSFLEDDKLPEIPTDVATKLSLHQADLSSISETKLMHLLDSVDADLRRQTAANPETLRLLQDLCYHFLALPRSFILNHVSFDRKDVVGRGAEATVYRGRLMHGRHSRQVVVREVVMPPKEWESPSGRKVTRLVHREAITHSQLNHPNILPFLGIYHEGVKSPPIIVLPFVERGSLQDLIASASIELETLKVVVSSHLLQCFGYLSHGVDYLHSRNPPIIHGDLHPRNVLIDDSGNPYLCDFGLSRIRHEVTRTRSIIQEAGRPRFLAPELSVGWTKRFRTSSSSDLFALSMTFFSAWSGQTPFSNIKSDRTVAASLRKGRRPDMPTGGVALDPEPRELLWGLLGEMWAQEPNNRPSSFHVCASLRSTFNVRPNITPQRRRDAPINLGGSPDSPNPWIAGLISITAAGAMLGAVVAEYSSGDQPTSVDQAVPEQKVLPKLIVSGKGSIGILQSIAEAQNPAWDITFVSRDGPFVNLE
ncbi:kinase-like protein [Clavulina sp. PMI_390]|nr:kinase-like protein [Clavulina sp. PMI_390]